MKNEVDREIMENHVDRKDKFKIFSKKYMAILVICLFWMLIAITAWVKPAQDISDSERRKLYQMPAFEVKTILSGKFMEDFEDYTKDQFPNRFGFRTIKSYIRFYVFMQKDNNDIYIENGYAAKLEYPLNENSISTAANKFQYIYDKYMSDKQLNIFFSVIPDKSYYLGANKGYPSMDYERLFDIIKQGTEFAEYIDITDTLTIEDYYKTDTHWKQQNLLKLTNRLSDRLGISADMSMKYDEVLLDLPFYGVYYGQSALPLPSENLVYLTNDTISNCTVFNAETNKTTNVYDLEKLYGRDPYDIYLSGASALLVIDNPNAQNDKELTVFRDSFGSSLVPLLIEGYSKITLIDIRYLASDYVGSFVEFNDQDVLFIYSTLILNQASTLK